MGKSEDLERKARFFARGFHGQKMRLDIVSGYGG
jgi:hypothetical protein